MQIPTCTVSTDSINNWIPLSSLEDMAKTDYDVLIVGTGAGGGAVLWRLCEQWQNQGKRIGIIERGDHGSSIACPKPSDNERGASYEIF